MASIEILENTLLKLLTRQGTDLDRQYIVLVEGELGYTTDTKRLYVGDGTTPGGILTGNKFMGAANDITTLSNVARGDFAFDIDNNAFYRLESGTGSDIADWQLIGTITTTANNSIIINSNNSIQVGTLSAGNFSVDAIGANLEIDSNQRIALSGTLALDGITLKTDDASSYFNLPAKLSINNIEYVLPSTSPSTGQYLGYTGINNELKWGIPTDTYTVISPNTGTNIPVGTIVPFVSTNTSVQYGWLPCNGQSVLVVDYPELYNIIGYEYGGVGASFNVPNLNNKLLYGSDDPILSTVYDIASATDTNPISATGINYIIKAISGVVTPSFEVRSPLSATVNDIDVTNTEFNPLDGIVKIGYKPVIVWFNQQGQILAGNGVTSVAVSGASYLEAYTLASYSGVNPGLGTYRNPYGNSGVYEINLATPVSDVNKAIVDIQALNFRQDTPTGIQTQANSIPLYDYGWKDPSTLVIGIITTRYTDNDVNSYGYLLNTYTDSGIYSSKTRFKVSIYES